MQCDVSATSPPEGTPVFPRKIPALLMSATVLAASFATAPTALAQQLSDLPPGFTVPDIDLNQSFSVPAGTTTSVDLGVPVQVDYRQDGWAVVANGTSVSVTAPAGRSQAAVPVSYGGYNATITLTTEAGEQGAAGTGGPAPAGPDELTEGPATPDGTSVPADPGETDAAGAGAGSSVTPERAPASTVDTAEAERLDFDAEIEGNALRVKLGMLEAANLYTRFKDTSREGLKVRYVDSAGGIIGGVERDIDPAARTLTLTYPEGQTPDNPFIIELVRDDSTAEVIVTLTAPGATGAGGDGARAAGAPEAEAENASAASSSPVLLGIAVAILAALAVLGAVLLRRRQK